MQHGNIVQTLKTDAALQQTSFPFGLDVQWFPAETVTIPDPYLKNWLLDTGSLTERLQSQCRRFVLKKIGQGAYPLHQSERQWLRNIDKHNWQVREVWLCADTTPWVFARSVLPDALIESELKNLGEEPLGKRLFNDHRFVRSEFQLCQIRAEDAGHNLPIPPEVTLWGRRSCFSFNQCSMIVAEVFLPDAPVYTQRPAYDV